MTVRGSGAAASWGTQAGSTDADVHCDYFAAGVCRSCALIETPYAVQLAEKERRCRELLTTVPEGSWLPAVPGGVREFRNRAKLVVGGRAGEVSLGILGPDGVGVDLRECLIQSRDIHDAIPAIASFLDATALAPYDVPSRRGELKFVHVTSAPPRGSGPGELMLRFVVRTQEGLGRIRARVDTLRAAVPNAAVISVNLLREHRAVLEGDREVMLHGASLTMGLGGIGGTSRGTSPDPQPVVDLRLQRPVDLHLQPQGFFQTNTAVARALYAQAAVWADAADPASVWDLYCGVGGFALHMARAGSGGETSAVRDVLGVELSEAAIEAARCSAAEAGLSARFLASDATAFALAATPEDVPELVVVNPPRRGIGAELAGWLERADGVSHVVYSSCNPESLARDLIAMPSLSVREARVFDMFPHTRHLEVAVLLERR